MTHTTREVEELQWQDELRQMFPPQGRENGAYFAALSQVQSFIERTLHQELQKARQEERERAVEIIKDELRTAPLEVQMTKGIIFASIVGRIQTDPLPTQVTE